MPIEVFWGDPQQTILHAQFGESWTLEEFGAAVETMYDLISQTPHTVHIVNDFSRNRSLPTHLLSVGQHVENHKAINTGISIMVGASVFVRSILQVAKRLYLIDTEIYMANSVEEAHQIIQQHTHTVGVPR
ncbi:MAG: hypothetical protein ABI690_29195 [Chloroflexota bacterium]